MPLWIFVLLIIGAAFIGSAAAITTVLLILSDLHNTRGSRRSR